MKRHSHIPTQPQEQVLAVSVEIFEAATPHSVDETIEIRVHHGWEMTADILDCKPQNLSSQAPG
jgi:hypothetical protein